MEHYMKSGLILSVIPLRLCRGALSLKQDTGRQDTGRPALAAGACTVKIVLKNAIKFPMENVVLMLTCCQAVEGGGGPRSPACTESGQSAQGKKEWVRFCLLNPTCVNFSVFPGPRGKACLQLVNHFSS
jgi:hypothetical protein